MADQHIQSCTGVPLPLTDTDQIIEAITCQTGGNVLKLTKLANQENLYNVRILMPDGLIRTVLVEGSSGNLIETDKTN